MSVRASTVAAMALLVALITLSFFVKPAETVPGGFSDTKVTDSYLPTALDFTPDGRMLVASKTGQLYVYNQAGDRLANPALNLAPETCGNSERGLLGVAVDPEFGTAGNNFVYLYYTRQTSDECPTKDPASAKNPVNRVARFVMEGDRILPDSRDVLIDNIPSPNGNHNGGDLHFGDDGKLYVSVGDGGCDFAEKTRCQYENDASRADHVLLGKILRINPDGSIPADNPYAGDKGDRCDENGRTTLGNKCEETYASGFRNPFRFAVDPDPEGAGGRIFANDVGGQRWEEVDSVKSGADYGWNICEGTVDNPYKAGTTNCDGAGLTGPVHQYNHNTGCESITAGAFVPDDTNWPTRYDDAYLFGDFVCGKMFSLAPKDGGGFEKQTFVRGLGLRSAVAMDFGPYRGGKALYYATFEDGGMIRRIAFTDGPSAKVETTGNNYGDANPDEAGLQMGFNASGSTSPTGNALVKYAWDFGDGTTQITDGPTVEHTYEQRGKYTVGVTVTDGAGNVSDPAKVEVFPGDAPPEPTINSLTEAQDVEAQADATGFRVGGDYTATGSADDPDGDTPVELEWAVVQVHDNNHQHPLANTTGEGVTFSGPKPEGLYSTNPDENYVQIRLTATDALGLSKTVFRNFVPRTTELAFKTEPAGLRLNIAGESVPTSQTPTVTSWEGYELNVLAPRQQRNGATYVFRSWSDGGTTAGRVIETPDGDAGYTAVYRKQRR